MPKSSYAYDLKVEKLLKVAQEKELKFKLIKTDKKIKEKKKGRVKLVASVVIVFAMFMAISCRYNAISEKNIEVQRLEKDLLSAKGVLATSEIKLEKAVDMDKLESYSKGQLGMQKPEKNQIIYLDVQNKANSSELKSDNFAVKILSSIKGFFGI